MTEPAAHAILCAGRLYCDLIFTGAPRLPTAGTEVFASGLTLHAGGGAFITAATFSALGHRAAQLSVLPAAPFDDVVTVELAAHGVEAGYCHAAGPGADPQITVAVATGGDRAFLTRAVGAALPSLKTVDFAGFSHLHIGELRTLQESPALIGHARAAGLTISLDCGWQDQFLADAATLIAAVDVFLPNETEFESLSAAGVPQDCAPLTVVKCGGSGARARNRGDKDWIIIASRPVAVVDATGAGDAFDGGFVSDWLQGRPLADCLATGNACGAATVQAAGGTGGLALLTAKERRAV